MSWHPLGQSSTPGGGGKARATGTKWAHVCGDMALGPDTEPPSAQAEVQGWGCDPGTQGEREDRTLACPAAWGPVPQAWMSCACFPSAMEGPSLHGAQRRPWKRRALGREVGVAVGGSSLEAASRVRVSVSFVSPCLAHSDGNNDSFSLWNLCRVPHTC